MCSGTFKGERLLSERAWLNARSGENMAAALQAIDLVYRRSCRELLDKVRSHHLKRTANSRTARRTLILAKSPYLGLPFLDVAVGHDSCTGCLAGLQHLYELPSILGTVEQCQGRILDSM